MMRLDIETRVYLELKERLRAEFGLEDGDDALTDTLEGATNLPEVLTSLVRQARERAAQAEVCAEQIKALQARKARHTDAADKLRALVAEAMAETGLRKLAPGDFTATIRFLQPKAEVVDFDALPEFYRKQEIKIVADKDAIKNEFERCAAEGDTFTIPGVAVSNGRASLTIRT